jgi:hypothetical protein
MKNSILCAAAAAALLVGASSARAQLLFGYEAAEPGMPYTGNSPAVYTVGTSTTNGVTQGLQSLQVTGAFPSFGGPASSALTDATRVALLNGAPAVLIDMTVPNVAFGFGNIDLHFFQPANPVALEQDQETNFSPTFATSSGQTVTLRIPLTLQGRPANTKLHLDPTQPFSYQIDLSYNSAADGPFTFYFDNLRAEVVPEPTSLAGCAAGALFLRRRRR